MTKNAIETANVTSDAKAVLSALFEHKGQNVFVTWERDCDTYKGTKEKVTKRTKALVRSGIDYANLGSVKSGIETGERGEVQPLPSWQEWACAPYILRHKGNGTEYVRLFPGSFKNVAPVVEYFIDGNAATKADVAPLLMASEKRDRDEEPTVFNVKVNSILNIG